jgi:hypothetical protein
MMVRKSTALRFAPPWVSGCLLSGILAVALLLFLVVVIPPSPVREIESCGIMVHRYPEEGDYSISIGLRRGDGNISDALPYLKQLHPLRHVLMVGPVTDNGLALLSELDDIESMSIQGIAASSRGFESLAKLPRLRRLTLESVRTKSSDLKTLGRLPAVEVLKVGDSSMDDDALWELRAIPTLTQVSLFDTQVTRKGADRLRNARPDVAVGWFASRNGHE